jgi:hypothetical protein
MFKVLSLLIAVALLGKAIIALLWPRRFYAVRQRHYASETLPAKLLVAPVLVLAVTGVTWYATLFHYRPWGWVVTGFLTLISCLSLDHVFRWQKHRARLLKVVANPKVWYVDCVLVALGRGFAALGLFVY